MTGFPQLFKTCPKTIKYGRIYYVLEGSGTFTLNRQQSPVAKGEIIVIPKKTEYDFEGNLTVFPVSLPAYEPQGKPT
jgi:mannose-6-phosphate isomerase-like protein (cupin superfamily)